MFENKVKILIVDDRQENLLAMKLTLQPLEDVEIYTALSGNEGLGLMIEHEFAVVLLDVQMPGMDGFETATLMHNHKATRNIPIIFVTAINKEEDHVFKGYQSGAVDYLFKPLNPEILLSKVKVFIKLYQQRVECERMQEELQKNRNLEALGILAGGIAHDFNNLLTTIFGYIELSQMLAEPGTEIRRKLSEAIKAANLAKQLTQQLLTFSKGGRPLTENASIGDLITDTTSMLLSGSNIKVHLEMADPTGEAEIDKGQICQVFQNLMFNAKEAMPDGGNLTIRTENVTVEGNSTQPLMKDGRYVKISFKDDGPGIPAEHIDKIFDPYFSSKKMGMKKGQGLGLTISHSIIRKHGGYMHVESEPGEGATFHIYLPRSDKSAPHAQKAVPVSTTPVDSPSSSARRFLVMEDEEDVAGAFREILEFLGYEISIAPDGPEAILLYRQAMKSNRLFAGVILDLTIRGGEGAEKILAKLRKINPEVKAIVVSGYGNNPIMDNYKSHGFEAAIKKPFNIDNLSAALKTIT